MTTWVQVVAADTYRLDPRNARFNLTQIGKERGLIISADGVVLAQSDPDPDTTGSFVRSYPAGPMFANVVGYSSLAVWRAGTRAGLFLRPPLASRPDHFRPALCDSGPRPATAQPAADPQRSLCSGSPTRLSVARPGRWSRSIPAQARSWRWCRLRASTPVCSLASTLPPSGRRYSTIPPAARRPRHP